MKTYRFDEWVDHCLYDPATGFYAGGRGQAGRRGDFLTSPEVGPLFGAVLGRALDQWWDELGRPDPFPVVDAGAGPGSLGRALELAEPRCAAAWELRAVDLAPGSASALGSIEGGVVIANELLDNLAFRILERAPDGSLLEVHVEVDERTGVARESLREIEDELPAAVAAVLDAAPAGRVPLLSAARDWVEQVLGAGVGRLVAFDYGAVATTSLVERGGWLRTYRRHRRGDDPYLDPGSWDITTDVAFDQLPMPDELGTQADFLRRFGIDDLVEEGRRHWEAHAARPDLAAMRMRSRIREADALLDPAGLGSWLFAGWAGTG